MTIKAHTELGRHYIKKGCNDEAIMQFNKALEISEKSRRKNDIIVSLINLGSCHYLRGDLFMAIECFQNAGQDAERSGNFYLKTLAELKLTDVSIAMGNYALALDILLFIEDHEIYQEDKNLRSLVELRRAGLSLALGDREQARNLSRHIARRAVYLNIHRLELRADLIGYRSNNELNDDNDYDRLKDILLKSTKYEFLDLISETKLLLGGYYINNRNAQNALSYFEDILESKGIPRAVKLETCIYWAKIISEQERYREAVEKLIETESNAAASGFIPIALRAADTLGVIYYRRGRADLSEDCRNRANSYFNKITSALPEGCSTDKIRGQLNLALDTLVPASTKPAYTRKPSVIETG